MTKRVFIYTVLVVLFFSACGKNSLPKGLNCNVNSLPDLADFSSTNYETFAHHFPTVKLASFKYNGTEKNITPDDPRLISLLNFLAFSNEQELSTWQKGYVADDELVSYLTTKEPMLEITFLSDGISKIPSQIIICGDSYLVINKTDMDSRMCAERWWPYGELIMEQITSGAIDSNLISYDGWGSDYWIDLLEYAGFEAE